MKKIIFLGLLTLMGIGFLSYKTTMSLFSNTGQSTNNTFTASELFPTATPSASPTPVPVNPGDIVINEINWVGSDLTGQTGQDDEWLELRNTTSNSINLAGWKITGAVIGDGDLNISSGIIPANGFFLISNFNETTSRINIAPDLVTTAIQLDNANAQYILKDSGNNIIDTADDDSGVALAGTNGPPKRSMERKTPAGDGTQGANWQNSNAHTNMDGSGSTDEFGTPKDVNSSP
ncbi:MAG: lamin tail domain-containing protein [Candidatus Levybacteria bacterium]|nr:lamin tail domain-containing protein [Candidatus Levybacteria bacterium]